ncbi:putative ABC exporter domain-containing protein [Pararhodonellum marinum]|uniref:putative ABC exporter domain-containing protein n=1 Tax=Pararhodonellum marinum TaxID=2755358 RepID=UPI00188EC2C5|nr:putative ABC exporter domain-containing protein [Pararhodonellum marinum]
MNDFKLLLRKDFFIVRNNIKLILKNPLRLIPYTLFVGYFFFIYFLRTKDREEDELGLEDAMDGVQGLEGADTMDFGAINFSGGLTLLALVFLVFQLFRATKKNVTFFSMADVNLLFTAPVKPSNLLIYYMVRSIIPALGGGLIFVVYGGSQLAGTFDLNLLNLALMALGIAFFFFILAPIKFLVYTLHTKYGIISYFKNGVFILGICLFLLILIPGLMAEKFWQGMFVWISSSAFDFFPIVGWSRALVTYVSHENLGYAMLFMGLYGLLYYVVVKSVVYHAGYYYEDVLESTKSNEDKQEKLKGKQQVSESQFSLNTKKALNLPDFGTGAKALYWRNFVHASRQDFHPIFGIYSLSMAGIGIIMAIVSHFDWFSHTVLYFYLLGLVGIYFMAGMGRTNVGDLKKPYFILIPDTWPNKLWNLVKLDVIQTLVFGVILIVPSVLIARLHWGLIPTFLLVLIEFYLSGFAIMLTTQVGFQEGWDRKLMKPLIIGGVFIFGILPALGMAIFVFIVTKQTVFAFLALSIGMAIVSGVLLNLTLDIIKRVELKEV